ncbi:MAG: AAA family ATPase [Oscillospiraceae bacterium]|nr:AAA family ATPase [Oscillospiraceae bacterium]
MYNERKYIVVIGTKSYFDNYVRQKLNSDYDNIDTLSDVVITYTKKINTGKKEFERSSILIVRNDDYHSIAETAHNRLGSLIEDITTNDANIFIHNPTMDLDRYLKNLEEQDKIQIEREYQEYTMQCTPQEFFVKMKNISSNIIGQVDAVRSISKSLWYLTQINRKKPFVVMLYGNSGIGKTEMIREIAKEFFDSKFLEKHLSMFKNNVNSEYLFGNQPNRTNIGFDLLQRESNLLFLDEFDKLADYFYSIFYTLFDNIKFNDSTYEVDISGLLIFLTSNYASEDEIMKHLGKPIYYRIDKFIHFKDFSPDTIYEITMFEIKKYVAESNSNLNETILYHDVCKKILSKGENARTIKNKVLWSVEDTFFKEVENSST